ncbi:hypothetical protein KFK09_027087 [Dendrobium nobile]|uniref:Protein LAZY 1 n=1 Tax=Dendrobium nobile TaxID=94219 RepID=A0A8T3AA28_DENNO|nr:hypothetical protein KFK09_027087 [Dendrobium nobile]
MKLLSWMHRKFRQNSSDTAGRDLAPVSACLYCLSGGSSPEERRPKLPPAILRQDVLPTVTEPPELTASILFDGLLHIGTFGSPIIIPENEPPENEDEEMSSAIVNEIAEREILNTTDNELIAISVELEKVIAAESEKERRSGDRISSASARPSHAGSIGKVSDVCPLQDFLFGSTVEAVEKGRRGSLGELFMRSRAAEERGGGGKREGMMLEDEGIVKAVPAPQELSVEMKRLLECRGSIGDSCATAGKCHRTQTKLQKILRIFQRKIHPENSLASKKFTKPAKHESKRHHKLRTDNKICRNPINDCGRQALFPKMADEKSSLSRVKESRAIVKNNSTGTREKWIKTDADYLVLEL